MNVFMTWTNQSFLSPQVVYVIKYNSAGEVENGSVSLVLGFISEAEVSLQQEFQVMYIQDCLQGPHQRSPILFGLDYVSGCTLRQSTLTANASIPNKLILDVLRGPNYPQYVASFGNSPLENVLDWVPVKTNINPMRQLKSTDSRRSMASVGTIRLCPACNTGYVMSYDLHAICEGCLGPDHANLALTPQSTCPSCRRLPPEEKQRRLAVFSPLEGEFPVADQCSFEEALRIFGAGRELDDSAPETATDISTPFLWTEDAEADAKSVQAQGLLMSATTPFPAMGALISALPDIVAKVANAKGVPVPSPLAQLPTDDLAGKFTPSSNSPRSGLAPFSGGNRLPVRSGGRATSAEGSGLHLHTHHEGGVPDGSGVSPSSCSGAQSVGSFWG
ncbi:hypothetical protein XENORESO_003483 [Xenotaenia resolanae]|uniref:Uncharacterized protein n=1 Tax=Xenotaenia resolanae TaxID=208358 RepID=A0ABV0X6G7_9TELE